MTIQGPIGLNVSVFLPRQKRAVAALPRALAHVVADRVADHAVERVSSETCLQLLADHRDQLALVLHLVGRVLGDDDGLVVAISALLAR